MLDIDFQAVQNIQQTITQFFPDDNSVMNVEEVQIGGKSYKKSIIQKDKMTFGIQDFNPKFEMPLPEQHGLVSYKQIGKKQMYINFSDMETKLQIETV